MIAIFIIIAIALSLAPAALADDTAPPAAADGITGVKIYIDKRADGSTLIAQEIKSRDDVKNNPGGTKIWVTANITQAFASENLNRSIFLFELEPWQNDDTIKMAGAMPIDSHVIDKSEAFTYSFSVPADLSTPYTKRLYSKFLLAVKKGDGYEAVGTARYIDNVNALSDVNETPPVASTKKGLLVQMVSDAKLLGVGHSTVKIFLNDLIAAERGPNTEETKFGGESFYFNIDKVIEYDKKIKALSDEGIIVTAALLLKRDEEIDSIPMINVPSTVNTGVVQMRDTANMTPIQHITHPSSVKEANAMFYGINTTDAQGVKYFTALMSFLADRYVRPGTGYGHITNIILGDEIGRAMITNNCGAITLDSYVRDYMRALRIVDTTIRSRFGGARVYTSFDQYWNSFSPNGLPANYEYKNKELFDKMSELSKSEGNFPWYISYQAHNEKAASPDFWSEVNSVKSSTAQIIDFNNIESLCDYVNVEMASYLPGERRKILITDCGFSSGMNSTEEKSMQAAAYALAYYKAAFLTDVEAYTYHRQVDSSNENGLSYGLWTYTPDTVSTAHEQKAIYDVFKYIDTDRSAEVTEFAKSVIGISDWTEKISNFNLTALKKNQVKSVVGEISKPSGSSSALYSFVSADLKGFTFTGWSGSAAFSPYSASGSKMDGKKNLIATFTLKEAGDYSGITRSYTPDSLLDLSASDYLTVAMRVDAPQGVTDVTAKLLMQAGGGESYEGEVKFNSGKDVTVSFKLTDWEVRNKISQLTLLVKPSDNIVYEGEYNLVVSTISTIAAKGKASGIGTFFIVLIIVVLILALAFFVMVIRARYIRYMRHQQKLAQAQQEARRRRQLPPSGDVNRILDDGYPRSQQSQRQWQRPEPPHQQGQQVPAPKQPRQGQLPSKAGSNPPVKRTYSIEDLNFFEKILYYVYKFFKDLHNLLK